MSMPPRLVNVHSILKAALPLIEAGWTKGVARRRDPETKEVSYCAIGAITQVSRTSTAALRARNALQSSLPNVRDSYSIIGWNDSPNRRKRDVVAAFKRAIKATA